MQTPRGSTKSPVIRLYKPSDKEALVQVFKRNVPQYFDKKEVKDFEAYLDQNRATYLTIELNQKIVGGTGYQVIKSDRSGRITWIFFDPDCSGQGLGRRAVEYCLTILSKDSHVDQFVVTTSQFAFRFFEKFGYKTTRTEENYWGEGLDLYEMKMSNQRVQDH